MSEEPIKLLWTAGLDSTFRLLELLVLEEEPVQPYYIVKPWPAVGYEVKAMIDIRRQIFRRFPNTRNLLLPTDYIDIREIKEDKSITNHRNKINNELHLAKQYDFLARFCSQNSLEDVEMCTVKGGSTNTMLMQVMSKDEKGYYKVSKDKCDGELSNLIYKLFKFYRFPVCEMTKVDFFRIATENDFYDILNMSWFCGTPWKGKPCGFCSSCIDAVKMGLGRRVPLPRRLLCKIHLPLREYYRKKYKNHS